MCVRQREGRGGRTVANGGTPGASGGCRNLFSGMQNAKARVRRGQGLCGRLAVVVSFCACNDDN